MSNFKNIIQDLTLEQVNEISYNPKRKNRSRYALLNDKKEVKTILIYQAPYIITIDAQDKLKIVKNHSILIRNNKIEKIFKVKGKPEKAVKGIDLVYDAGARGGLVITPGFVNAHAHPPMYLLRSSTMLERENATIEESLERAQQIERAMNDKDLFISALGDFTEQQKMGTTTVLSHYHTPQATSWAAHFSHLRLTDAISCASTTDPKATLEHALDYAKKQKDSLITPGLTMHGIHRANWPLLKKVKKVMAAHREFILTLHCGETEYEIDACKKKFDGLRPVEVLNKAGLLSKRLILSHAVHFSPDEIKILAKKNVGLVHLPTSNRIHKSGKFKYYLYHIYGAEKNIALGTDSVISKNRLDLVSEAMQAKIMHQDSERPLSYTQLFKMITSQGAAVMGYKKVGKILPGYQADIALWKLKDRGFMPFDENNPSTLIGNLITHGSRNVRDLMINGKFIISNRVHNLVNESQLLIELEKRHTQLRKRI